MGSPRLSVLDLVPISSGSDAATAVRDSLDLVAAAEACGYHRYWFAEHHLNPGVAGTSPPVMLALAAAHSDTIRLGSAAMLMGHRAALATVEEFGLLDAAHPGRFDLGLGRSPGGRRPPAEPVTEDRRTDEGLLLPVPVSLAHLAKAPKTLLTRQLQRMPGATTPPYGQQVDDVLALLAGTYRSPEGVAAHVVPGEGADVEVWILGSSPGESAHLAGSLGLPFAANYHISPTFVVDAVAAYRSAFRPSSRLSQPYVAVSADAVVAPDAATARRLAAGFGQWVLSVRSGVASGVIPYPSPEEADAHPWTDAERALVADRTATQFVGSPVEVADQLTVLAAATGADELVVTTITHDPADRARSYELLAAEWGRRTAASAGGSAGRGYS